MLNTAGQPLDSDIQNFLEPRFGYDFSRVRVHTDARAAASAQAVQAVAYTVGSDIVFGRGAYRPSTSKGRRLLAHELTHVVQQADQRASKDGAIAVGAPDSTHEREADAWAAALVSAESRQRPGLSPTHGVLQRACGPTAIGTPTGCMGSSGDIIDYGGSSERIFRFRVSCDEFLPGEEARLRTIASRDISPADTVDVDGFASEEGDSDFNEYLSCARAQRVADIVNAESGATVNSHKHGATPGYREDRRSAVITLSAPAAPQPVQPPPAFRCGPDVTSQVGDAVDLTKRAFAGWSRPDQDDACQNLISLITGGFAWDIIDLHNNAWIHSTYRPACATVGGTPPCGSSIQVGSDCYYAGSVNYVIYGVMMKLCHDHYSRTRRPSDAADFTQAEMLDWIDIYKGTGFTGLGTPSANFVPSQEWAVAGYRGWPAAAAPSGDRSNCHPSCPTGYRGGTFRVHWYPHVF